jgi:hypothetical protein
MAFCNSCGASIESGARFCPKCGASQPSTAAASPVPSTPPPAIASPPQNRNTLRIVLAVVAAVIVLGAIAIGVLTMIGLHIARRTHVTQNGDKVRVESPFGTVTTNSGDVSKDLGPYVYPGARLLNDNAANVSIAGVHTVAADFESDDPASKVADFYKAKFPNANVNVSNQDQYTIVSTDNKNLITVNIESQGSKTRIHIASVGGKDSTSNPGD